MELFMLLFLREQSALCSPCCCGIGDQLKGDFFSKCAEIITGYVIQLNQRQTNNYISCNFLIWDCLTLMIKHIPNNEN